MNKALYVPWFGPGVVTCPAVVPWHPSSKGQMVSDASGSRVKDRPFMVPSAFSSDSATQTCKIRPRIMNEHCRDRDLISYLHYFIMFGRYYDLR